MNLLGKRSSWRRRGVPGLTCGITQETVSRRQSSEPQRKGPVLWAFALCLLVASAGAAEAPNADRLLPPDTLLVISLRDPAKFVELLKGTGWARLWEDPTMKPFAERLSVRWREEFRDPVERDLGFRLRDAVDLCRGPATLAMLPPGQDSGLEGKPGWLFLMDVGSQAGQLRTNLTALAKNWSERGRSLRSEQIRGSDFLVLPRSTNGLPRSLQRFLPGEMEYHELGEDPPESSSRPAEWLIGAVGSHLVIANAKTVAEQAAARLSGNALPSLAEQAAFATDLTGCFRDAPLYAWVNAEPLLSALARREAAKKPNPNAPTPVELPPLGKLFAASGLLGLKSVGFAFKNANPGPLLEWRIAAPESNRRGFVKLLAAEPKETSVPPFVPADVTQFRRWRLDGQLAWAGVEKMLSEFSPQAANVLNFIFDTANTAARQRTPGFDIRKNLIGNLGNDIVVFRKSREPQASVQDDGPRLYLVGSPRPEELAAAMQSVLVFVAAQAGAPAERDFLGKKIYSVTLPSIPLFLPGTGSPVPVPRHLHYAATSGYVAFCTDAPMLEEYLRSADNQAKPLRQAAGLAEASEKVVGPATSMFAYHNYARSLRGVYGALRTARSNPASTNQIELLPSIPGMKPPERRWQDLADFSLLPPFEVIEKYLGFSVSGLEATSEGLTYRMYFPPPPPAAK